MTTVISVENVSKSYMLQHEFPRGNASFREVISETAGNLSRKMFSHWKRNTLRSTTHEKFWALKDVNFEVNDGDRLGIIGRNGAGKSTLLKILSRITEPSTGTIHIRGRLSSLLEVGTGFHPELTGRENIFLNGAVLGMSRVEVRRKFDEIVDFSEVERFLDTPVKRYSSGMYVRLAFAVSAFLEPDVILLDEVLSVGDAIFQRKCQLKMRQLAHEGRTVLFVSHSMGAIRSICESGIVLQRGRASEKLPIDEAIANYLKSGSMANNSTLPAVTDEVVMQEVHLLQRSIAGDEFEGDLPIDFRIRFRVLRQLNEFRVGFFLKTNLGDALTRALAADWDPESALIDPGLYEVSGRIPANFLVEGGYVFQVHCSRFGIRDYFDDLISIAFKVRRSRDYNCQYPGEEPFGTIHLNPGWSWTRD